MILIIGYGNPACGDDGLGLYIAQYLAKHLPSTLRHEIEVVACHQLSSEMTEAVSQAELVIFIGAESGEIPGEIIRRHVTQPPLPCPTTHNLSPAAVVAGARCLHGKAPEALLISVICASFGLGEALSPAVLAAMPDLLDVIYAQIAAPRNAPSARQQQITAVDSWLIAAAV